MAFVRYIFGRSGAGLTVSLTRQAYLAIAEDSRRYCRCDDYTHATITFSGPSRLVTVTLTDDPATDGALPLRFRRVGARLYALTLARQAGYEGQLVPALPLLPESGPGLLLFRLDPPPDPAPAPDPEFDPAPA